MKETDKAEVTQIKCSVCGERMVDDGQIKFCSNNHCKEGLREAAMKYWSKYNNKEGKPKIKKMK